MYKYLHHDCEQDTEISDKPRLASLATDEEL
jgi:hypothetical protein